MYGCLAEPTRLAVLHHLAHEGQASVSGLTEHTGSEQTNVSHHLAKLRECGLVVSKPEGKHRVYRIAHPRLVDLLEEGARLAEHIEASDAEACLEDGCCTVPEESAGTTPARSAAEGG